MKRTSQTDVAVLGALSIEPMSGYRIRRAIADVFGHFWYESFGQIYPTLARLEAAGLVTRARDRADERVVRVSLTDAGRALAVEASCLPQSVLDATEMTPEALTDLRQGLGALRDKLRAAQPPAEG